MQALPESGEGVLQGVGQASAPSPAPPPEPVRASRLFGLPVTTIMLYLAMVGVLLASTIGVVLLIAGAQARRQPQVGPAPTTRPSPQVKEPIRQAPQEAARRVPDAMERAGASAVSLPPRMEPELISRPVGTPAQAMRRTQAATQRGMSLAAMISLPMSGGSGADRPAGSGPYEAMERSPYAALSDIASLAPARQVAVARYGGYVVTTQRDKLANTIVEVYPPTLTQRMASLTLTAAAETRFMVSNDGQYVLAVTPGAVCFAEIWSTATGQRIQTCELGSGGTPTPLGFTADNMVVLLWSDNDEYWLQVIDIKTARGKAIRWTLPAIGVAGYRCNVSNVTISPDGRMIAVVDGEYQLRLIDPISGTVRRRMPVPFGDDGNAGVTATAFSSDNRQVAILYDEDRANGNGAICFGTVNITGSRLVPLRFGRSLRQQAGERSDDASDKGEVRKMDWLADNRTLLLYGQLMVDTKKGTVVGQVYQVPESGLGPTLPDGQSQLGEDRFLLRYPKAADPKAAGPKRMDPKNVDPKGVGPKEQYVYKVLAVDTKAISGSTARPTTMP